MDRPVPERAITTTLTELRADEARCDSEMDSPHPHHAPRKAGWIQGCGGSSCCTRRRSQEHGSGRTEIDPPRGGVPPRVWDSCARRVLVPLSCGHLQVLRRIPAGPLGYAQLQRLVLVDEQTPGEHACSEEVAGEPDDIDPLHCAAVRRLLLRPFVRWLVGGSPVTSRHFLLHARTQKRGAKRSRRSRT